MNSKNINNNEIDSLYPVWMEVDLEQLRKNYELISLRVGSSVGIISIVKCNAYGHGLVSIARCLERLGSDKLGVGSVEEALTLRNAKIKKPVVILYPSQKQHFFDIIENDDIEVSIDNYRDLLRLDDNARKKKKDH